MKIGTFKLWMPAVKIDKFSWFLPPVLLSIFILWICSPGFMSYDSFRMLEEARSSVRGGIFPAMPVYILRLFDVSGHGPTLMIGSQNFIILFSVMFILRILGASLVASIFSLLALLAMPTVIGCMLVLWKDVTLVAFLMLSISLILWAGHKKVQEVGFYCAKWLSLLLLLIATYVRFNSLTSTLIILIYWISVFYKNHLWNNKVVVFCLVAATMVFGNNVINNHRFPSFEKLEPNEVLYMVMAYDLVGISGWSRTSLIPFDSNGSITLPKVAISDIDAVYSSLGSSAIQENNAKIGNVVRIFPDRYELSDIFNAWAGAVREHPISYLRYRLDLFYEIIGAKKYRTFEPTHFNKIDENSFNIKFEDREITQLALKYIKQTSGMFIGKPWFVFLLSVMSCLLIWANKNIDPKLKSFSYYSFAAAFFYIVPFIIIPSSGEVRYSFPAIILSFNTILVYLFSRNYRPQ